MLVTHHDSKVVVAGPLDGNLAEVGPVVVVRGEASYRLPVEGLPLSKVLDADRTAPIVVVLVSGHNRYLGLVSTCNQTVVVDVLHAEIKQVRDSRDQSMNLCTFNTCERLGWADFSRQDFNRKGRPENRELSPERN